MNGGGDLAGLIREGAQELGLNFPKETLELLANYGALLQGAARRIGFGPFEPRTLVAKHLLDSATCLLAVDFSEEERLADVGSGVGLPGLVLAVCLPQVTVTLVESRARRVGFLRWAVWRLGLANAQVERARSEELVAAGRRFDRVVARAVAPVEKVAQLCLPLLAENGKWVAMLGPRGAERLQMQAGGAVVPGGELLRVVRVALPWGMGNRWLAVIGRKC